MQVGSFKITLPTFTSSEGVVRGRLLNISSDGHQLGQVFLSSADVADLLALTPGCEGQIVHLYNKLGGALHPCEMVVECLHNRRLAIRDGHSQWCVHLTGSEADMFRYALQAVCIEYFNC